MVVDCSVDVNIAGVLSLRRVVGTGVQVERLIEVIVADLHCFYEFADPPVQPLPVWASTYRSKAEGLRRSLADSCSSEVSEAS